MKVELTHEETMWLHTLLSLYQENFQLLSKDDPSFYSRQMARKIVNKLLNER